ncbi:MAG: transposase [Thiovulaceae bacterium]|nr:transposase [Sulfurimonadaceae bacterium]
MGFSKCIFCQNHLYKLSDGMLKCSCCKRKYSPSKLKRDFAVIDAFIENMSILHASMQLNLNYQSVKRRYDKLRAFSINICEDVSETFKFEEFEEYCFSYNRHKKETNNLFKSYNFITFAAKEGVYNFTLPSLERFKGNLSETDEQIHLMKRFMRNSHIGKLKNHDNNINMFWEFFENHISRFKGVDAKNFGIYLKEAEFKFNHSKEKQKELLKIAWIESMR